MALIDTAFSACMYAGAGFFYGVAHDVIIKGIPGKEAASGEFPALAAKACAVSYLALALLKAALFVAYDADILDGRSVRFAGVIGVAAWGAASIVAFRQFNLIANQGTIILSGVLALRIIQLMNA